MKKRPKKIQLSRKILEEIMLELWENANFNPEVYSLVEEAVEKTSGSKKKNQLNIPIQQALYELTTIRNRNLINTNQQKRLKKTVVGIFGLSVGSQAAITWMLESRASTIKISDPDIIATSNLNRIVFGPDSIGKLKTEVVAKRLLKINPFSRVLTINRTDARSIEKIFSSKPSLDVVVDAIDDIKSKVLLRKLCKKYAIPLVSAADVGDNVMLDIERYDQDPQTKMFHGRIKDIDNINFDKLSSTERLNLVVKIIGYEQHSEVMLQSLLDIGKKLITWPQLAATATIAGGVVTTTIKKIVLGEKVTSGRYYISLDDILVKDINKPFRVYKRRQLIKQLDKR
jgi:tRNA A37 threonylcarbamoyladenosine dehydratase